MDSFALSIVRSVGLTSSTSAVSPVVESAASWWHNSVNGLMVKAAAAVGRTAISALVDLSWRTGEEEEEGRREVGEEEGEGREVRGGEEGGEGEGGVGCVEGEAGDGKCKANGLKPTVLVLEIKNSINYKRNEVNSRNKFYDFQFNLKLIILE